MKSKNIDHRIAITRPIVFFLLTVDELWSLSGKFSCCSIPFFFNYTIAITVHQFFFIYTRFIFVHHFEKSLWISVISEITISSSSSSGREKKDVWKCSTTILNSSYHYLSKMNCVVCVFFVALGHCLSFFWLFIYLLWSEMIQYDRYDHHKC